MQCPVCRFPMADCDEVHTPHERCLVCSRTFRVSEITRIREVCHAVRAQYETRLIPATDTKGAK